jgi:aspartate/methionine/tyrosine aminotransferase
MATYPKDFLPRTAPLKVMKLQPFEMERWQSTWENQVEYNLSESGVQPLKLSDVLGSNNYELFNQSLGYSQTNGTQELRTSIATLYPKAAPKDVLVTNGSSEANFVALWSFIGRRAEIAVMMPNYMQIWGLAKTFQAKVRPFWLTEKHDQWLLDLRALEKMVRRRTALIAVCNPNNPTGAVLNEETVEGICKIAKKAGAWILSDEVYHGAELDGNQSPTFWEKYEKVIVTNGLSKAYGLPGLRIGWAIAGKELTTKLWSYHDYTTIGPGALSDFIARKALQPELRAKILSRTRQILNANLSVLNSWVNENRELLSFIPPRAGAIALLKYALRIESKRLAEMLLKKKSTLIVPGKHFGMDRRIRIGYGIEQQHLKEGLHRIGDLLSDLRAPKN